MSDEIRAREMDPIALLAAVDEGRGPAYQSELRRRLDRMAAATRDGTLDALIATHREQAKP